MENNMSCNLVKDLLPIYFDGIASDKTNIYVKKHLDQCEICQSEYKNYCDNIKNNEKLITNEVNPIKKLRKKLLGSFIAIIMLSIIFANIDLFCLYTESPSLYSDFRNLIVVLFLPIGKYVTVLVAIYFSIIWKKTLVKKKHIFWINVIITYLGICFLYEVGFLLFRVFFLISRYYV